MAGLSEGWGDDTPDLRCLEEEQGKCVGAVEWRPTPPYGERAFPRCEFHSDRRWERYEGSLEQEANSPLPPSWFDPLAAGERWNEDD